MDKVLPHSVLEPERFPKKNSGYIFGEGSVLRPPTFQSLVAITVHLPERFRGGCSFGAVLTTCVARQSLPWRLQSRKPVFNFKLQRPGSTEPCCILETTPLRSMGRWLP